MSVESKQDEGADEAWAELVQKRYLELKSGAVKGISWEEIKREVKN